MPSTLPGTFRAKKKNGEIYYRSSITYKRKHISLGSFQTEQEAHQAYLDALAILTPGSSLTIETICEFCLLPFGKCISLLNFRDNNLYIKNPIYLRKTYFEYHYSQTEVYLFDIDDLFYYSEHKIMKRNQHLFVADYGMQITILSRYGIRNYAVLGRDYKFNNGNPHDLRYENIQIINPYYGVQQIVKKETTLYQTKIHILGDYVVGTYKTLEEAAIAYNKAIDQLKANGSQKNYQPNFIENLSGKQYAEIYSQIAISSKIQNIQF